MTNCSKCNLKKELAKGRKFCKDCKNEYEKNRRKNQSNEMKEEIRKKERERYNNKKKELKKMKINNNDIKVCSICNKKKTLNNFYLAKNKGTIRSECKICSSKKRKEYYKKNKEQIIKQTSQYKSKKINENPLFKLEVMIRSRISSAFKSQGQKKSDRTWKYINCSAKFLQEWIKFQLYDNMTFDNYGEYWHIDHCIPCSKFNLEKKEDIEECFSWQNIRPYTKKKNLQKGNEIIPFDIVLQELKVKYFIKNFTILTPEGYCLKDEKKYFNINIKNNKAINLIKEKNEKRKIWSKAKLGKIQEKKRKCKKGFNQNLPKYIYYRESHGGKYKGYVVEYPKSKSKRFSKSIYTLEKNLELAKQHIKYLENKNNISIT